VIIYFFDSTKALTSLSTLQPQLVSLYQLTQKFAATLDKVLTDKDLQKQKSTIFLPFGQASSSLCVSLQAILRNNHFDDEKGLSRGLPPPREEIPWVPVEINQIGGGRDDGLHSFDR